MIKRDFTKTLHRINSSKKEKKNEKLRLIVFQENHKKFQKVKFFRNIF